MEAQLHQYSWSFAWSPEEPEPLFQLLYSSKTGLDIPSFSFLKEANVHWLLGQQALILH